MKFFIKIVIHSKLFNCCISWSRSTITFCVSSNSNKYHTLIVVHLLYQLEQVDLPDTWQRRMFLCQVFVELNLDADGLAMCEELAQQGLHNSMHLRTQRAVALRNLRGK